MMPTYTLAAKPEISEMVRAGYGDAVVRRIVALATRHGYVVTDGPAVTREGAVILDADRDPSADWAAFDPSLPTAEEEAARAQAEQVRLARTRLSQIATATTFTAAQRDAAIKDTARILNGVIGVLIDRALIERDG